MPVQALRTVATGSCANFVVLAVALMPEKQDARRVQLVKSPQQVGAKYAL